MRTGDGRRARWFDPEKALSVLRGQGVIARRAAALGLPEADLEELERARVKRRRALLRFKRGRKKGAGPPAHHLEWAESFGDLVDYRERIACAGVDDGDLGTDWAIARTIAREDFSRCPDRWPRYRAIPGDLHHDLHPDDYERAAARVWKAVKPLRSATNSN